MKKNGRFTAIASLSIVALMLFSSAGVILFSDDTAANGDDVSPQTPAVDNTPAPQDTPLTDMLSEILTMSIPFFETPVISNDYVKVNDTLEVKSNTSYDKLYLKNGATILMSNGANLTVGTIVAEGDFTIINVDGGDSKLIVTEGIIDGGFPFLIFLTKGFSGYEFSTKGTVSISGSSTSTVRDYNAGKTEELKLSFNSSIIVSDGNNLKISKVIDNSRDINNTDIIYKSNSYEYSSKTVGERIDVTETTWTLPSNGSNPVFSMVFECDLTDFIKTSESLNSVTAANIIDFVINGNGFPYVKYSIDLPYVKCDRSYQYDYHYTESYYINGVIDESERYSYSGNDDSTTSFEIKGLSFSLNVGQDKTMAMSLGLSKFSLESNSNYENENNGDSSEGKTTIEIGESSISVSYSNNLTTIKIQIASLSMNYDKENKDTYTRYNYVYNSQTQNYDTVKVTGNETTTSSVDYSFSGINCSFDITAKGASEILAAVTSEQESRSVDYTAIMLDGNVTLSVDSIATATESETKHEGDYYDHNWSSISKNNFSLGKTTYSFVVHSGEEASGYTLSTDSYDMSTYSDYDGDKSAVKYSYTDLDISFRADAKKIVEFLFSDEMMSSYTDTYKGQDIKNLTDEQLKETRLRFINLLLDQTGVNYNMSIGSVELSTTRSTGTASSGSETAYIVKLSPGAENTKALKIAAGLKTTVSNETFGATTDISVAFAKDASLKYTMYNLNNHPGLSSDRNGFTGAEFEIKGLSITDKCSFTIEMNVLGTNSSTEIFDNMTEKTSITGSGNLTVMSCKPSGANISSVFNSPVDVKYVSLSDVSYEGIEGLKMYYRAMTGPLTDDIELGTITAKQIETKQGPVTGWNNVYKNASTMRSMITGENSLTATGVTVPLVNDVNKIEVLASSASYTYGGEKSDFTPGAERQNVAIFLNSSDGPFIPYDANETGMTLIVRAVTVAPLQTIEDEGTTVTKLNVSSEGSSFIGLSKDMLKDAIASISSDSGDKMLDIAVDTEDKGTLQVTVSKDSVKDLADKGAGMSISSTAGTIKLDSNSVKTLSGKAVDNLTVSLNVLDTNQISSKVSGKMLESVKDSTVISIDNSADVHELNGKITVSVPYTKVSDKNVNVYYLNTETDKLEIVSDVVYKDGTVTFTIDHMSMFSIMENDEEAPSDSGNKDNNIVLYVVIAAIAVAAVGGIAFLIIRKR